MRVLLTGAGGFLGWHTRLRLHATTTHEVVAVERNDWGRLDELAHDVEAVIHVAGVNRGTDKEVAEGNIELAQGLATALSRVAHPVRVVYANSIQHGNDSPYGRGKATAAQVLSEAALSTGGRLVDVRLPNLFGEHGRPRYNSFVATFVAAVVAGDQPCLVDRPVALLHAQDAAQTLIDAVTSPEELLQPAGTTVGVAEVYELLREFHHVYQNGEIPDLSLPFRVNMFNTYRAAVFAERQTVPLTAHSDPRGTFFETVRAHGGQGQTSFSSTVPGITRGEHYHLHKVERFVVLQGHATVSLRRMFASEVVEVPVTGEQPTAVDMPVGWAHNITNTGEDTLLTLFWTHDLFTPEVPDTYPAQVRPDMELR